MFRFFRKHRWILIVVMAITAITFVTFMGSGPSRGSGGNGGRTSSGDNYGSVYGKKITAEAFRNAQTGFFLSYWFRSNGEWPDKNPNFSESVLEREVYVRLMLSQKANDLGIHVGDDAVVTVASEMLRALGRNGRPVPPEEFAKQVLQPRGMTAQDFQNFVRQTLIMEQLQQAVGQTGGFVTPQEAAAAYQRDHQELSAQMVVFSASNYLASVTATPAAIAQFYTNYLAEYRLPDRVQVSYVVFEVTNFFAGAEKILSQTNLNDQIDAIYRQYGANAFPDAKTPAAAKAQIRTSLIHQRALFDARKVANDFASAVFGQEPARPENLAAVAKEKGLNVHVTAPFSGQFGPEEFTAPPGFIKAAFGLTPDEPFAGPIVGPDAVYVLAFAKKLPSEIPPLDQILSRVTRDYQWRAAAALARQAGTNFAHTLTGMTADRGFATLAVSAGLQPQMLPAFSLSTRELPELGDTAELNQLKQAAFTTPLGKTSDLRTTDDGGFIVYVQSRLPVDQAKMNTDLPQYLAAFRRERLDAAFNEWANLEANRQLRNTPVFQQQFSPGAAN
jgi:parvulin-like peptidyl-prolyl isomerase